jgi:glutathione-regulated potassium-efflux system ancillary protein KefC
VERGVLHIERETLDAALMSGRSVLELMGWERHAARTQAMRFRQHTIDCWRRWRRTRATRRS